MMIFLISSNRLNNTHPPCSTWCNKMTHTSLSNANNSYLIKKTLFNLAKRSKQTSIKLSTQANKFKTSHPKKTSITIRSLGSWKNLMIARCCFKKDHKHFKWFAKWSNSKNWKDRYCWKAKSLWASNWY